MHCRPLSITYTVSNYFTKCRLKNYYSSSYFLLQFLFARCCVSTVSAIHYYLTVLFILYLIVTFLFWITIGSSLVGKLARETLYCKNDGLLGHVFICFSYCPQQLIMVKLLFTIVYEVAGNKQYLILVVKNLPVENL